MSEQDQVPDSPAAEDGSTASETSRKDLFSMPLDDMAREFESAADETQAEPEAPAVEPDTTVETQPAGDTDEEPAEATETEAETDTADSTEPPTDLEILRARLEKQEAETLHFKTLADRHAGEIGSRQQQTIRQMREELDDLRRQATSGEEYEPQATKPQTQKPVSSPSADENTTFLVAQALQSTGLAFLQSHPELQVKVGDNGATKLDPEFVAMMQEHKGQVEEIGMSNGPMTAQRLTNELFNTVHSKWNLARQAKHLEELERRKANQSDTLRNKKRAAASASGGAATAKPKPKNIDPFKMKLEDLRKHLGGDTG